MENKFKIAVASIAAGIANGFFGSGGGLFLVPVFRRFLKGDEKNAFATAIAVTLPLSLVSLGVYATKGEISLYRALPFVIGAPIGGYLGGRFFKKVPVRILKLAFSGFIIYGGVRLLMR